MIVLYRLVKHTVGCVPGTEGWVTSSCVPVVYPRRPQFCNGDFTSIAPPPASDTMHVLRVGVRLVAILGGPTAIPQNLQRVDLML